MALGCVALGCVGLGCVALGCVALGCVALGCVALGCVGLGCVGLGSVGLGCVALGCVALGCVGLDWDFLLMVHIAAYTTTVYSVQYIISSLVFLFTSVIPKYMYIVKTTTLTFMECVSPIVQIASMVNTIQTVSVVKCIS